MKRAQSLNILKRIKNNPIASIAQKNLVSLKESQQRFKIDHPLRINLPDYFNIPKFHDNNIDFTLSYGQINRKDAVFDTYREQKGLKKKLKDLTILAQGMKRAKNIKQESRYYFIQGVVLYNSGLYLKSIELFQKFLKIVLFIKDDKSIQLALNSIAICYMYLNKPQQAIQYHQKQSNLNESSQDFIGKVNMGLCKQMLGKKSQAYQIYCELAQTSHNLNQNRLWLLEHLFERTKDRTAQNYFLTEDASKGYTKKLATKVKKHQKQNLPSKEFVYVSPNRLKSLNAQNKQRTPQKMLNNSFSTKKYDSMKVNFAIFSAEQNLNSYLQDMKHSFSRQ